MFFSYLQYLVWGIVYIAWNIFVICVYLQVGSFDEVCAKKIDLLKSQDDLSMYYARKFQIYTCLWVTFGRFAHSNTG